MKELINKNVLKKLAELARIEISADKEEKLLKDLREILEYFEELKGVDVSIIESINGAIELKNVFRDDESIKSEADAVDLIDAFPEKENNFLKVPGVFE